MKNLIKIRVRRTMLLAGLSGRYYTVRCIFPGCEDYLETVTLHHIACNRGAKHLIDEHPVFWEGVQASWARRRQRSWFRLGL